MLQRHSFERQRGGGAHRDLSASNSKVTRVRCECRAWARCVGAARDFVFLGSLALTFVPRVRSASHVPSYRAPRPHAPLQCPSEEDLLQMIMEVDEDGSGQVRAHTPHCFRDLFSHSARTPHCFRALFSLCAL